MIPFLFRVVRVFRSQTLALFSGSLGNPDLVHGKGMAGICFPSGKITFRVLRYLPWTSPFFIPCLSGWLPQEPWQRNAPPAPCGDAFSHDCALHDFACIAGVQAK